MTTPERPLFHLRVPNGRTWIILEPSDKVTSTYQTYMTTAHHALHEITFLFMTSLFFCLRSVRPNIPWPCLFIYILFRLALLTQ